MAIGRTEFQFSVSGADEAAAAHRNVARAADEVGTASMRAAEGVRQWDSMTMTFVTVAPKATDAARKLNEQLREQAMRQELAARESAKGASALALVGNAGSKTIAVMMRLSYLLPGLGFAGMIGGIAAGLGALYDAMAGAAKGTGMMTAAMVEYGRTVDKAVSDSIAKFDDLRVAQARAGLAMVGGALGVKGEQLPFDQAMGAQKLQGEIESARETQRKSLAGVAELERRRAALDIDRAKAGNLLPTDPLAIDLRRRQIEINEQRRGYKSAYDAAATDLRRLSAPYEPVGKGGRAGKPVDNSLGAVVGRIAAEKTPRRGMEDAAFAGIGGMQAESYDASTDAARAKAQEMADFQIIQDQRNAMMIAHMQGLQTEAVATANAMDMLAGSFDGAFGRMVDSATGAGGLLMQALSVITGAVGSMMTNIIISGNAGSKGVAKAAGNALAGLSAQAFGYGVLLEGLALAAALASLPRLSQRPVASCSASGLRSA